MKFFKIFMPFCLTLSLLSACKTSRSQPPQDSLPQPPSPQPSEENLLSSPSESPDEQESAKPEPQEKSLEILALIDESNNLNELLQKGDIDTLSFSTDSYDSSGTLTRSCIGHYAISDGNLIFKSRHNEGNFEIEEYGYTDSRTGYPACYGALYEKGGSAADGILSIELFSESEYNGIISQRSFFREIDAMTSELVVSDETGNSVRTVTTRGRSIMSGQEFQVTYRVDPQNYRIQSLDVEIHSTEDGNTISRSSTVVSYNQAFDAMDDIVDLVRNDEEGCLLTLVIDRGTENEQIQTFHLSHNVAAIFQSNEDYTFYRDESLQTVMEMTDIDLSGDHFTIYAQSANS